MPEEKDSDTPEEKKTDEQPQDNLVETQHTITINGEKIAYTVTTGTIVLKEETPSREKESEGYQPKAEVFFVAYTRDDVEDKSERPLTFSFNGGPGSASVWMHLGLLGPRRVESAEDGQQLPPPFRLVDNEFSLLDKTDLVFIDPVSTGYSRVVKGEKAKRYHGFKKDIETVGDFIRLYTSRNLRWTSPKFLIGESYGTTRASGLAGHLQRHHGMYLNGIMLVSSILNFQTARFVPGNDLPFLLFLPSYTAAAWYHKRLDDDLQADLRKTLAEVEEFATNEYNVALMKGDTLTPEEHASIKAKLARYTGLSPDYIERTKLRINTHQFFKELLRDEGRTIGRLDSRLLGRDRDNVGEHHEYDPLLTEIMGTYTACFNQYIREELEFEQDLPYNILNIGVWPWSFAEHENEYLNVAETLRQAMTINPHLKIHVSNGYYDLGTPYFATEYTFNHMQLNEALKDNVSMDYYESGHMMYMHLPSLAKQKDDLAKFIEGAA